MAEEVLVVFTTWPNAEDAEQAARVVVEERLAACANIGAGCRSIYRWQGAIETTAEIPVMFKTTIGRYPELERRIKALHWYEVPEIVAVRVTDGLPAYLRWVEDSCEG